MSKNVKIEFGNYICKFGDLDLLDRYEEIIAPAFLDSEAEIKQGESKYFFKDVVVLDLGITNGVKYLGITGVFCHDTVLTRHQVIDRSSGEIKKDFKSIESCPTANFLLILNNHRLVYSRGVSGAPSMSQFRYASERLIKNKTRQYINKVYGEFKAEAKAKGKKPEKSKAQLLEETPLPQVTLNALTCSDEIGAFVDRFETLSTIQVLFTKTNSENDNRGLFESVQHAQDDISSDITILKHYRKEGLDLKSSKQHIINATAYGNQQVSLVGKDIDGMSIRGNNEDFKLKIDVDNIGDTIASSAKYLFLKFMGLVKSGSITIPDGSEKVHKIISSISKSISGA